MKSKTPNFQKQARRLIEISNAERRFLLEKFSAENLTELAREVKELCYSFWTSEPTKTQISAEVLQIIYQISPQKKILAYLEWNRGIAEITRGKLAAAIKKLDASAEIFRQLNDDYEAANTQVAKLYALAMLGKYDEAIRCGELSLKVFERHKDLAAQGKIKKNLGNLVARQGDERRAERFYLAARRIFRKIENLEELTMAENSLANTYAELNDFRRAERFYALALKRAKKTKMPVTEAEIEASLGNLALFRGQLDRALNFLETARRKYEALKMPHQTAIAELEIANIYLELNLTDEAAAIYEQTADKFQRLAMRGEEAVSRANSGRIAVSKMDLKAARTHLQTAARLYSLEKNQVGAATVKIAQAKLELAAENYRKSLKIVGEIELILKKSENLRHNLSAQTIKAEALRNLNETEKAATEFKLILAAAKRYEQPNHAQIAHVALGKIAVSHNDLRLAERHFKSAIKLNESIRAPLAAEEFRMSFQADKLAPFELLAKIYLAKNQFQKAFAIVEQAKARTLAENLNEDFTLTEKSNSSGVLQKKLERLREELNWFYSRLNRADESETKTLQRELIEREKQIADVMRQIESTKIKNGTRKNSHEKISDAENFKRLQTQIGERCALIEFVCFDGVFSAFVVTDRKINFVENLANEAFVWKTLENLQFQFGALRYGAANLGAFADELKRRADFHLRTLYQTLFAPLEKYVGTRDLIIVPTNALHYVPFHALFDGEKYIIENRRVVYAPSATVWRFLAAKRNKKSDNALLLSFADEQIPLAEQEAKQLKKLFGAAKLLTGNKATVENFSENAKDFDVLHLACHGQFRPENPLFSSLHLADGRLTVRDVSNLKLKAELVTLSACETGLNKIFAGEEILGLARGFLSAGAKSLLLTLWTVNDAAAADLMAEFYEQRKNGKTSSESLQIAQKNFIKQNFHPYYWSPFVLVGK